MIINRRRKKEFMRQLPSWGGELAGNNLREGFN